MIVAAKSAASVEESCAATAKFRKRIFRQENMESYEGAAAALLSGKHYYTKKISLSEYQLSLIHI